MKFDPVVNYSIPLEELHPAHAYDRGFLHGQEMAKVAEQSRIAQVVGNLPFYWVGDKKNLEAGRDEIVDLIFRSANG